MKVAIIGYGKMGKTIHGLLENKNVEIFNSKQDFELKNLASCDVAIEFSRPEFAVQNIINCFKAKVPVVVGTTGWYNNFEEIKTECKSYKGAMVYATNFSVGVNVFFELNKKAAELMNGLGYEVSIKEIHHTTKLDAPSGTAITLANGIIEKLDTLNNWALVEDGNNKHLKNELSITAVREPNVKGTHHTNYSSSIDTIELSHIAHSRAGFAKGSILAAKWILDKQGIHTFKKVLGI
ncbi:UNVERIFIED_CONTAM: hypothetical protein GTU68_002041 [Idotea baltica]|nr:hypothetical protein [Idotea baltica]